MTSLTWKTASSTQKVVAPFLRNRWTNQLQNQTRYLVLRLSRDGAWWIFDKSSLRGHFYKNQIFNRIFWVKNQFFNQTDSCDLLSKIHYTPSLDNLIISIWPYFGVDWSNGYRGKVLQLFEYSKLFLQTERSCKLFNGLEDFKMALYVCPNHMDDDIHSDHSYLDTLGIPLNSTLRN